jgi:cell wall assembly regulator SMI1
VSIDRVLSQLESWLKTDYRAAHGSLQPGLSDAAIDALLQGWPYKLSDDVRALYRWHDGFEDAGVELLPGLSFLPLAEALALGSALWEVSAAQAKKGGADFFPRAMLPVFSDENNDAVLLVQGAEGPSPSTPAQVVALQRGQRLYAFERLEDLLAASLDLLKRGVYRIDQDRDRVELTDEALAQAAWRRYPLLYLEGVSAPELTDEDPDGENPDDAEDLSDEQQAEHLMSNLMSMLGLHPDDLDPATASLDELRDLAELVPPTEWSGALQQRFHDLTAHEPVTEPAETLPALPAPKDSE